MAEEASDVALFVPPYLNEKIRYTVLEATQLLNVSCNFVYELARLGEIPVIKFGKRKLVPKVKFDRMLGCYQESESLNERAHL